jgi:hypothetical protein
MDGFEMDSLKRTRAATALSLFTSGGTLVCCALPALLVALGAGAALSSLVSTIPQLIWFSINKTGIFLIAAVMLAVSGYLQWRAKSLPCPVDPDLAKACASTRKVSLRLYLVSVTIYLIGGFFAFAAPLLNV